MTRRATTEPPPVDREQIPQVLLTIDGVRRALNIGMTTAKELVSSGQIESVRIGRCRRVPVDALAAYVQRLRSEQVQQEAV